MKTIDEWLNSPEIKKVKDLPTRKLITESINRDPLRAVFYDPKVFYSPADGVILFAKIVKPDQDILNIKGVEYTINSLIKKEIKDTCLIISIFMTCYDVHVNRTPTDGFYWHKHLDAIKVMNLSMRPVESGIIDRIGIKKEDLVYGVYNERVVNDVLYPEIGQKYYIVQIADFEVDVIAHFAQPNDFFTQGERFAIVRLGSQVDLIIPFTNKKLTFNFVAEEGCHVEAGIDKLIEVEGMNPAYYAD